MLSATALTNFLACPHLTTLDRAAREGELKRPFFDDPEIELLRILGIEHEQAYLRHLREDLHLEVVSIPQGDRAKTAELTIKEMKRGAPALYQAVLIDGPRFGYADFLIRVDKPGQLGFWSYEAVETKLARSTRVTALIQLCFYSDLLSKMQGVEPDLMHVVLGRTTDSEKFPFKRYAAYFRRVLRDYNNAWETRAETYPEPTEHCGVCTWSSHCDARWRDDDHLSLVAGISRSQRKALVEIEVATVADLARLPLPVVPRLEQVGAKALENIREQARIQVDGRDQGRMLYELLATVEVNKGLAGLPLPCSGDMFLDFESDPFAFDQGLEYLVGIVTASEEPGGAPVYDATWAFDPTEEKRAFEEMIAKIMRRRSDHPGMHIYHFASYEVGAIKRLAGRHSTCTDEVDELLRGGVFVDLYRVVRQSLRASVESYSIKKLEPLYDYTREVPLRKANHALKNFGVVLTLKEGRRIDDELRAVIAGYNRDDCVSTLRLRNWLEERRKELEAVTGKEVARPQPEEKEASENLSEYLEKVRAVESALTSGVSVDEAERTEQQRACVLLANLLEWHRREDKSAWWEYFRLRDLSTDELIEDRTALGGLVYLGEVGRVKRSVIHRYRFPAQDYKIAVDDEVRDPKTEKSPGAIVAIDDENLSIDIKRRENSAVPHPAALIPCGVVSTKVHRQSLLRLGESVVGNGIDGPGELQSARDILLRRAPRVRGSDLLRMTRAGGVTLDAAKQVVLLLEESVLPVQGPPGSGKTYNGARMAVELVVQKKRVGITGPSHKVISNLLAEICEAARETGVELRIVQKADDEGGCHDPMVTLVDDNAGMVEALDDGTAEIAAGTAWLWAREEMAGKIGVLFVDEAGQMSLANVLAISQAAKSLVLLGDPQQLDQPQKGIHPPGAGSSALSHLLNGRPTIEEGRGLFLKDTWRLHPDVCAFTSEQFYDGRLVARSENRNQRLNAKGLLDGTGLRFVPVEHSGDRSESEEEVARVAELVTGLLSDGATWTDKEGKTQPLELKDILIVAPYNAQVVALKKRLPDANVGTVDKFQGQEAPVVFYSMATSSAEDAPRGMEFLYSLNRLNVATSRAQCLAVIVASPALFRVQCGTPRQMELANSFCRFLEMAKVAGGSQLASEGSEYTL